jgi:bisphosphoglycerate-independent phosphoglycerate mutase (AlkP superfamily)
VLFSNREIASEDPGIEDMAPTALELFGIVPPPHMEGKSLLIRPKPEKTEIAA